MLGLGSMAMLPSTAHRLAHDLLMNALSVSAALLLSYLLGGVSFAYLLVRLRTGADLRLIGSGNLGATNAGRALGKKWAVIVYVLDVLKGLVPTLVGLYGLSGLDSGPVPLGLAMGVAAILGHCFPIYFKFRGGKGVATTSGVILALSPLTFLAGILAFAVTARLTHYVSLGSLVAGVALPIGYSIFHRGDPLDQRVATIVALSLVAIMVTYLHRKNLRRILSGEEPQIGAKP